MAHDSSTLFGTTTPDEAHSDAPLRTPHAAQREAVSPTDTCTVVVSLKDTPGALSRITATLGSTPVLALAYVVTGSAQALAEIRMPRAYATRARHKLTRMVDTTYVSEPRFALLPRN
ncbi:hypothetical protein ABZ572_04660 [Streptomyces sp. NPDC018338]|uniref:hypothetical protein n=1 Tax=Streptomyces sp. NPDC018338 TaxID=3157192 RepID=UPI0033DAEDF8